MVFELDSSERKFRKNWKYRRRVLYGLKHSKVEGMGRPQSVLHFGGWFFSHLEEFLTRYGSWAPFLGASATSNNKNIYTIKYDSVLGSRTDLGYTFCRSERLHWGIDNTSIKVGMCGGNTKKTLGALYPGYYTVANNKNTLLNGSVSMVSVVLVNGCGSVNSFKRLN